MGGILEKEEKEGGDGESWRQYCIALGSGRAQVHRAERGGESRRDSTRGPGIGIPGQTPVEVVDEGLKRGSPSTIVRPYLTLYVDHEQTDGQQTNPELG